MVGYQTVTIRSNERGGIDLEALRDALGPDVAALMITNPSTLGIFEDQIDQVVAAVQRGRRHRLHGRRQPERHPRPLPARARPASTSCTSTCTRPSARPHGGGGPGAGPVGVSERLEPFLPAPMPVLVEGDAAEVRANAWAGRSTAGRALRARLAIGRDSIGKVRSCYGNFGMFVRAYTYIRSQRRRRPADDQRGRGPGRQLPARAGSTTSYDLPYDRLSKHEVVFSGRRQKREHGVTTLDIAKAILDHGIHPPTIYFPLIVEEALMVEPTETESLETLDRFVEVMREIAEQAADRPGRGQARADHDPGRPPRRGRRRAASRPAPRLRRAMPMRPRRPKPTPTPEAPTA